MIKPAVPVAALVLASALGGCAGAGNALPDPSLDTADAAACMQARTVISTAEHGLSQIVRQPAKASQLYLDYAAQVRAATSDGSTQIAAAGETVARAYGRLADSAVTGTSVDTEALREATVGFVAVCGAGTLSIASETLIASVTSAAR